MSNNRRWIFIGIVALCFLFSSSLSAGAFSSIVAYGDSLSDNGNIAKLTDGDVWVETLASNCGSRLYNNAYSGATTGMDNPNENSASFGLQWQVETFQPDLSTKLDMNNTLFTVWAGANDYINDRSSDVAATNISFAMQTLADNGARDILVPNLPDLGKAPAFNSDDAVSAAASEWTEDFNGVLALELVAFHLDNPDVNLYFLDTNDIFNDLSVLDSNGKIVNSAELFMPDGIHPRHIGHDAIAAEALQLTNCPVPLPAPVMLLGSGLMAMGVLRRRLR